MKRAKPFRLRRRVWLSVMALGAVLMAGSFAFAQAGPRADVIVIHAKTVDGGGSTDPRLASLKQLKNVPFSSYNAFSVLDTKTLPLVKTGPSLTLPNGVAFSLSLSSVEGKQLRIKPIMAKSELPEVSAKADEPFFVAGQSHQGGILIIAVTPRL